MKNLYTVLFVLVFIITSYCQDTIHVPGDYTTIQAAINASDHGDIVLVAEGIYFENIKFNGKKILLASHFILDSNSIHIDNTIIDGSQAPNPNYGSVVTFDNNEDSSSIICGFTITGGTGTYISVDVSTIGGGILARFGCTITNNKITGNNAINTIIGRGTFGGGIGTTFLNNKRIIIRDNEIYNNSVSSYSYSGGAGIGIYGTDQCLISNNLIHNNSVSVTDIYSRFSGGGGIWIDNCNPEIRRNLIMNNSAPLGGAISATTSFQLKISK
jgi:hypothetical protein